MKKNVKILKEKYIFSQSSKKFSIKGDYRMGNTMDLN